MVQRTALVTGGSGGIGSAIVRRFAADGFAVIVGYNSNLAGAQALVDDLPGGPHECVQISVDDASTVSAVAEDLDGSGRVLDVLVNCAGVTEPVAHDDLDGLDDELIDRIFATNWRGPFAMIRALRPALERSSSAVIVNISSIAGVTGVGSNVAYCASKAALDSMTRSLARALAPKIRVVSVSPGFVLGEYASRMPPELLEVQTEATPLKKLATGDDVAAAVIAVVEHLPMTTGSIIAVDGGRPLGAS